MIVVLALTAVSLLIIIGLLCLIYLICNPSSVEEKQNVVVSSFIARGTNVRGSEYENHSARFFTAIPWKASSKGINVEVFNGDFNSQRNQQEQDWIDYSNVIGEFRNQTPNWYFIDLEKTEIKQMKIDNLPSRESTSSRSSHIDKNNNNN